MRAPSRVAYSMVMWWEKANPNSRMPSRISSRTGTIEGELDRALAALGAVGWVARRGEGADHRIGSMRMAFDLTIV